MKMPYVDETKACMQPDGYRVVGIDACDHDVLAHGCRLTHQFDHQAPADALTAPIAANVNAVFHAVPIAWPGAKFAETAETGNSGCVARRKHRKAALELRLEPGGAALRGQRNFGVHRRGVANHFVVDL